MAMYREISTHEEKREMINSAVFTLIDSLFGIINVDENDEFSDMDLDEIDIMDLAMEIEDHLSIDELSDRDLGRVSTVGDFIQLVLDKYDF